MCACSDSVHSAISVLQAELVEACQEKGVGTKGTKDQLASNLLAFFAAESSVDAITTAAATSSADDIQCLSTRVAALDAEIQTRTEELQSLHDGDRCSHPHAYALVRECICFVSVFHFSFCKLVSSADSRLTVLLLQGGNGQAAC